MQPSRGKVSDTVIGRTWMLLQWCPSFKETYFLHQEIDPARLLSQNAHLERYYKAWRHRRARCLTTFAEHYGMLHPVLRYLLLMWNLHGKNPHKIQNWMVWVSFENMEARQCKNDRKWNRSGLSSWTRLKFTFSFLVCVEDVWGWGSWETC